MTERRPGGAFAITAGKAAQLAEVYAKTMAALSDSNVIG